MNWTKATKRTQQYNCDPNDKRQGVDLVYVNTEVLQRIFGHTPARVQVIVRELP